MELKKPQKESGTKPPKKPFNKDTKTIFRKCISPNGGKLIAVTGGIGTGKTFVLDCLGKLGFEVFNADKAIHEMMLRGGKAFNQIAALFPQAVCETGIDRKILGEIIVAAPEKLVLLEQILHPLVRQAQVDLMISVRNGSGKSIVFEIPLLFENKREKNYDVIITTTAPSAVQRERVLARSNMTEEKLDTILKKQVSDSLRIKGSQYVINTGKSKEDTIKQIKAIMKDNNVKRDSSRHGDNRPVRKKR